MLSSHVDADIKLAPILLILVTSGGGTEYSAHSRNLAWCVVRTLNQFIGGTGGSLRWQATTMNHSGHVQVRSNLLCRRLVAAG